jgi:UDP-GlcNAc:undecaprenyl-phosphate GlcNAc-1-phosphate transferase
VLIFFAFFSGQYGGTVMSVQIQAVFIFLTSLGVAVVLMPRLARIGTQVGLVDWPNSRKVHRRAKPFVGGLGMILSYAMASILFVPLAGLRGYFAGVILLFIVGFLDDYKELGHRWKFLAQVCASFLLIFLSKTYLMTFGNLLTFGDITFGVMTVPLTIFCIVGITNAINMVDGMDGLAGGVSLIASLAFAVLCYMGGLWEYFLLSLALSGAIIGFLRFNWFPAKVFMGDSGSLFLGFSLVFLSIIITQTEGSIVRPVVPLILLATPIADTLTLMTKRVMNGKSPFHADKYHLHHILVRMGLSRSAAVGIILFVSAIFAGIAILGTIYQVPEHYLFLMFMSYFTAYFTTSFFLKEIMQHVLRNRVRARVQVLMMKY